MIAEPYYADDWLSVYQGDSRAVLAELPAESVHCVVTSPPYWGLRDYGVAGQLGLEPTPEEYVANLVAVFREVRRVLRDDGTVWLNLGDSYAGSWGSQGRQGNGGEMAGRAVVDARSLSRQQIRAAARKQSRTGAIESAYPIKPKDLVGIPWMVAFALRADGWYLRSDIIWAKPNPMPESVTDRPTKAHEYLFLLSKSPRYYYDADAVREDMAEASLKRYESPFFVGEKEMSGGGRPAAARNTPGLKSPHMLGTERNDGDRWRTEDGGVAARGTRNLRSVWTIATQPYPGAHFATFPPKLVEPCIKAGTSERGVCPECGAPWVRVVERGESDYARLGSVTGSDLGTADSVPPPHSGKNGHTRNAAGKVPSLHAATIRATGWRPTCPHVSPLPPQPAIVLDPFAGSGTTGMVAQSLSRRAVLIDLSMDYLGQLMARNRDIPLGLGA